MAQRAVVVGFDNIQGTANMNEMKLVCGVFFVEEGMDVQRRESVEVLTQWSDNAATIKTKISNAIVSFGNANGYSALTSNNIIMPSYIGS